MIGWCGEGHVAPFTEDIRCYFPYAMRFHCVKNELHYFLTLILSELDLFSSIVISTIILVCHFHRKLPSITPLIIPYITGDKVCSRKARFLPQDLDLDPLPQIVRAALDSFVFFTLLLLSSLQTSNFPDQWVTVEGKGCV
ncbi:hypothetical protein Droror1_Dr00008306 [Drosera rotundifolia]